MGGQQFQRPGPMASSGGQARDRARKKSSITLATRPAFPVRCDCDLPGPWAFSIASRLAAGGSRRQHVFCPCFFFPFGCEWERTQTGAAGTQGAGQEGTEEAAWQAQASMTEQSRKDGKSDHVNFRASSPLAVAASVCLRTSSPAALDGRACHALADRQPSRLSPSLVDDDGSADHPSRTQAGARDNRRERVGESACVYGREMRAWLSFWLAASSLIPVAAREAPRIENPADSLNSLSPNPVSSFHLQSICTTSNAYPLSCEPLSATTISRVFAPRRARGHRRRPVLGTSLCACVALCAACYSISHALVRQVLPFFSVHSARVAIPHHHHKIS